MTTPAPLDPTPAPPSQPVDSPKPLPLASRVALVTGAGAPRLGRAIALALAKCGADLAVHFHSSADGAAEVVAEAKALGRNAVAFRADLTDPAAAIALPSQVVAAMGSLGILVNSAANFLRTPVGTATTAQWDATANLNLRAPFLLTQAAAPFLRASASAANPARVVNLADTAGLRPWPSYIPYCVSKAGLIAMTQGFARALAPEVTVNAIAPGPVMPAPLATDDDIDRAVARIPLGRTGSPDDVVACVLLCVVGTGYMTGAVLPVDGGRSVG